MSESDLHPETDGGSDDRGDSVSTLVAPDHIAIPTLHGGSSGNIHDVALPTDKTVISKKPLSTEIVSPIPSTSQSLGEALVGKKFGNYELAEFVGGGGMGAVFRATDTSMGRTVAVKVLSRDQTDDETIRRFRNEAHSAARLDHPNIARAYYVGEHEGWNYIVFEYVEGTNLRDLVDKQGPLPIEQALNFTLQVAQALDHAAGRDVVHRDIKPSNVLVTPACEIKLVDMGLARLHQVESSSDDLTASGVTLGTFDYISPEQARDPRIADSRSDIYSLGCTLYFMLAGRPPFPDGTALQKLLWHSGEDPPDPRRFRPELPPQVIRLLERMLAKRPSQRPQSPRELIGEIAAVAGELGYEGFAAGHHTVLLAPSGPSAWSRAAGILVPVGVLVLLVWIVGSWRPPGDTGVSLRPKLKDAIPEKTTPTGPKKAKTNGVGVTVPAEGSKASPVTPENSGTGELPIEPATTNVPKITPDAITETPGEAPTIPPEVPARTSESASGIAAAPTMSEAISAVPAEAVALSSSTAPPGAAKAKITRLVVRPDGKPASPLPADQEIVATFARACQRAGELGVQEIELQFSGEIVEKPMELGASRLTIRAATGHKPVIVFRPQKTETDNDKQMIRLKCGGSGKVTFQGVELRMELPTEASYNWSLFAIYQMQQVELIDTVLTIKDVGSTGGPIQTQVAFFALQPRRFADAMKMMETDMAMMQAMSVNLTRCVARGDGTFLRASEESPLKIVWKQGLFVSTQRLIDTEGSPLRPADLGQRLDIDLDHVTAIIPQGFYSMRRKTGNAYQLKADVVCRDTLLQTGSQVPLFEFADLGSIDDVKLTYGGERNVYAKEVVFLRFHPTSKGEPTTDYKQDFKDIWSDQRPQIGVQWQNQVAIETIPAYRQSPKNFQLHSDSPFQAGFDAGSLPEPSEETPKVTEKPAEPTVETEE